MQSDLYGEVRDKVRGQLWIRVHAAACRRNCLSALWIIALAHCLVPSRATLADANEERPNIVWITAEDLSPALGCYGDAYATTPHLDHLAEQSIRYSNAFATAPVCSPARNCLITGRYPPSLGTHHMRSAFQLPEGLSGFPALLRRAGYFTTNNEKTDYNTADSGRLIEESWDESSSVAHWRSRPNVEQPFFSVFNLMDSHQSRSMVWPTHEFEAKVQRQLAPDEIHQPAQASLPPYYPDTPVIRRVWARFYDCVTAVDKQVGDLLRQLHEDGLDDNTIVFFFGDHGSGMPRHKRLLLDSGTRVPLMVRVPSRWQHLVTDSSWTEVAQPAHESGDRLRGVTSNRLVSFIDFPPTVLALAGITPPEAMEGLSFLEDNAGVDREYVFAHRDRVDEALDLARSVRSKRFLYIRNFMPHLSYCQPTAWPDQGSIRHEFYRLSRDQMTDAQWQFAGPNRPVEELYDCVSDPHNLRNLAQSPEHAPQLEQMRRALREQVERTVDRGFIPETLLWNEFRDPSDAHCLAAFTAAEHVGVTDESTSVRFLHSVASYERYWGAVALAGKRNLSGTAQASLSARLNDDSTIVAIESANALLRHSPHEAALDALKRMLRAQDMNVVLHAVRTVELLGTRASSLRTAVAETVERYAKLYPTTTEATFVVGPEQDLAMFIGFSANAFLDRTKTP